MTRRERFLATMIGGRPDRPAAGDYFYYQSTRERWEREGLPSGVDMVDYFGMDFDPFHWTVPVSYGVIPDFGSAILEENDEYKIMRHGSGDVVKILKNEPPPAMPQWLSYPLQSRRDWEEYKKRLDPDSPGRVPADLARYAAESATRDYPLGMWLGSSYGYLRDWWGVEAVSCLFYDDPALIEEMMEVLVRLSLANLERVLQAGVKLDWVMFWEDMAYNHGSLISPQTYGKFCGGFYHQVMAPIKAAGIPVIMLDSDGNIDQLMPYWLDVGVTVMHPMEVASGMDVCAYRKRYGKALKVFGGIDKRALAGTRADIRREVLPKLAIFSGEGGFIPACDHAIPPDVSLDNYRYFRDLVAAWAGG